MENLQSVLREQKTAAVRKSALAKVTRRWRLYLMLLIPLVYIIIFRYVPMTGIQLAFKNYNARLGIWGSPWVGFKHFRDFFRSAQFSRLLGNTISLSLYNLIAGFFPPIILAIGINEARWNRLRKTVQMVTYAPYFLSTVVVTGITMQLLSGSGVVNTIIKNMGGTAINFLGTPGYFKSIYVWSGIWQHVGYDAILYIAALAAINPELYEAATVDGANIWKRIWHVDIPSIMPTAIVLLIMSTSRVLNVGFEKVYLLQNSLNLSSSKIISTYVYKMGLVNTEYGFSTAVGLFQSVVSLLLMVLVNNLSRKVTETSLW
ncbi:ABC transporter permease subunit [Ruminococcaceae bacterium OttesenSCG-928-L11]|nr:ABC transporter permease subunit [Ruminococcaceae bacterium OttesenSCG-928-L11]